MDARVQKQLIVGIIFILIVVGIGYGFYRAFFVVTPTCFDGIQNGKEEGIDCGVLACGKTCEPAIMPLQVQLSKFFKIRQGDYDFVAQVYNPNSTYGAAQIDYNLMFSGAAPADTWAQQGTFYILPGQTRYFVLSGLKTSFDVIDAKLNVVSVQWEKLQSIDTLPVFVLQNKNYSLVKKDGTYSQFEGTLFNGSDYDFDKVEAEVLLFDKANNIIGVNRTELNTFLSKTSRYFQVSWPLALPADVSRQDVQADTNVFDNANFIRRYGTQEKFQKFY